MKSCCEKKSSELERLRASQLWVLKVVLLINATMFVIEATAGILASSTSLMADSLDMFGDAVVYGFSIYAVARGTLWKVRAARIKGYIMLVFGIGVIIEALSKSFSDVVPLSNLMAIFGATALVANIACLVLLYKHRRDDINMTSTWICSRNDIIANTSVLCASWLVAVSGSNLPDVVVGSVIATLFIASALGVLRDARNEVMKDIESSARVSDLNSHVTQEADVVLRT